MDSNIPRNNSWQRPTFKKPEKSSIQIGKNRKKPNIKNLTSIQQKKVTIPKKTEPSQPTTEKRNIQQIKTETKTSFWQKRKEKSLNKAIDNNIKKFFKNANKDDLDPFSLVNKLLKNEYPESIKTQLENLEKKYPNNSVKNIFLDKFKNYIQEELGFNEKNISQLLKQSYLLKQNTSALSELNKKNLIPLQNMNFQDITWSTFADNTNQALLPICKEKTLDFIEKTLLNGVDAPNLNTNLNKLNDVKQFLTDLNTTKANKILEEINEKLPQKKLEELKNLAENEKTQNSKKELEKFEGPSGQVKNFYGIKKSDLKALQLLSKFRLNANSLTQPEKTFIVKFLENAENNKELNGALTNLLQKKYTIDGVSEEVIKFIRDFSFKSRTHKDATKYTNKLEKILNNTENAEKMKLHEYNIVSSFSRLASHDILQHLLTHNLLPKQRTTYQILKIAQKAHTLTEQVKSEFKEECNNTTTSRDFLLEDIQHKSKFRGIKRLPFVDWVEKTFVTKYGHAAKINKSEVDGKTKTQLSHVYYEYQIEELTFDNVAYSKLFRMDVTKLISPEAQEKLKEIHGDNWETEVNSMYDAIEKKIHIEGYENLKNIKNSKKRLLGAASPKKNRFFSRKTGHESAHKRFFTNKKAMKSNMICSEFASSSTAAALMEFNKQLAIDLKSPNDRVVNMPFGSKVKFKKIHPELLVRLLKRAKCIEEVPKPPVFEKIFG